MIRLVLRADAAGAAAVRSGHPSVYVDCVHDVPDAADDGAECDVVDERGHLIGRGFVGARSRVVCRLLTRRREPLDRAFFRKRLQAAHELRRSLHLPSAATDAYRLVFGEADRLPGLTVDRQADGLVLQTPTAGMDRRKDLILDLLRELVGPRWIAERNDQGVRAEEGLPVARGFVGEPPAGPVHVRELGLVYEVDPVAAMKTGHFSDQRENRRLLDRVARGAMVLDLFCYTGGFGLYAARAGAASVLSVDQSEEAIAAVRRNAELNGLAARMEQRAADGFEALRELEAEGRRFDVVVLDPPAFAKTKGHLERALDAYQDANARALKLLRVGGHLLTCSCSFHVSRADFRKAVARAAGDARRLVRLVGEGRAAPCHPVLLNVPETDYLKALLVQVVDKVSG